MGQLSARLRLRLGLMALFIVVPALAVIIYDQTVERGHARERAVRETVRLAHVAAGQQAGVFDGVQRLLLTLSLFPGLLEPDPAACATLLPQVLHDHPAYINVWVANADGSVFCSASESTPGMSNPNDSWLQRTIRARTTAVGDYEISPESGKAAVVLAHPLIGASEQVDRILAVAIGLETFNVIASDAQIPQGATLTLADRHHTILARYPDGEAWIGRPQPEMPASRTSKAVASDSTMATGADGIERVYTIVRVNTAMDSGLLVSMAIDRAAMFAEADEMLRRHLLLLGLVTLVALGVALVGGQAFVLRPIETLRTVT